MPNLIKVPHDSLGAQENLNGFTAYDTAGNKIGKIDDVIAEEASMRPVYLVIDNGGFLHFGDKYVVPMGEVRSVDDNEQRVVFKTLTKDALEGDRFPRYDDSWWESNDYRSFNTHERNLNQAYGRNMPVGQNVDYSSELYQRPQQGANRLQLMEERLRVNKQREQVGEVKVGKRLTQHPETVTVPVREERVVIERTPGSGQPVSGNVNLGQEQTIDVQIMKERVDVEKQAVVAEEINIRKETVEREQQVQATVRKEELVVNDNPDGIAQVVDNAGQRVTGQQVESQRRTAGISDVGHGPDKLRR